MKGKCGGREEKFKERNCKYERVRGWTDEQRHKRRLLMREKTNE